MRCLFVKYFVIIDFLICAVLLTDFATYGETIGIPVPDEHSVDGVSEDIAVTNLNTSFDHGFVCFYLRIELRHSIPTRYEHLKKIACIPQRDTSIPSSNLIAGKRSK